MSFSPDLLIKDESGQVIAVVEAKNRPGLDPEMAASMRRNLMAHGYIRSARYFLLVSQDYGHLWMWPQPWSDPPLLSFSMDTAVARLAPDVGEKRMRGEEFELFVRMWLNNLSISDLTATTEPERELQRTGFLEAIRQASVVHEV